MTGPEDGCICQFSKGFVTHVTKLVLSTQTQTSNTEDSFLQVMGPDDGYICQFSKDVSPFWASRNSLELGSTFRQRTTRRLKGPVTQVRGIAQCAVHAFLYYLPPLALPPRLHLHMCACAQALFLSCVDSLHVCIPPPPSPTLHPPTHPPTPYPLLNHKEHVCRICYMCAG